MKAVMTERAGVIAVYYSIQGHDEGGMVALVLIYPVAVYAIADRQGRALMLV